MDMRNEPEWAPISIENEQAVLGTLLVNNDAISRIRDFLRIEHFHEPIHRLVFECIEQLTAAGKPASPLSMRPFIQDHQVTPGMTVSQYLARLASDALPVAMIRDHALIVRDLASRRVLMDVAYDLLEPAPRDVRQLSTKAIELIDEVISEQSVAGTRGMEMAEVMTRTVDTMAKAYENNGAIMGLTTGLTKLDRKLHGLNPGQLVVLGGRPGMGKSAVAIHVATHMAQRGKQGIFFSLEMTDTEIGARQTSDALFNSGPITYRQLSAGHFDEPGFQRITEAARALASIPLRIEPAGGQTLPQIAARARQAKNRGGLAYIVIDHLQIVRASNRYQNKVHQIGELTAGFKALAKELDIVVILLSQLSRALESREDKRPTLNDLRESGDIEQDADVVIMAYRPSYYLERRIPDAGTPDHAVWQTATLRAENRLELLIEKQRGGPTGTVEVFCNIGCNAIRDLDEREVLATAQVGV